MNKFFNLPILRTLYHDKRKATRILGTRNRIELKITLRKSTRKMLGDIVPVGAGQYGSPFAELAIRMLMSAIGEIDPGRVAEELVSAVTDRPEVAANLHAIATAMSHRVAINELKNPSE